MKTPNEILLELGQAIRARRLLWGWTQEDAAARAGMGLSTWKRMEVRGPGRVDNLIGAAFALSCEEGLERLFPAPAASSLDELLRLQAASAAPPLRRRAPRRRRAP